MQVLVYICKKNVTSHQDEINVTEKLWYQSVRWNGLDNNVQ